MSRLLSIDGKLVSVAGSLLATGGGVDCCCDPANAVLFVECCDGDPRLWIAEAAVVGCEVVKVGEFCYRRTGETAKIPDLQAAGLIVLLQFNTAAGDGCVPQCFAAPCRQCPRECCLTVQLPACRNIDARRCCGMGSAYRLEYTETRDEVVTGVDCPGAGCFGNDTGCVGFTPPGGIRNERSVLTATMIYAGRDGFGVPCSGVTETANRFYRRTGQFWTRDAYQPVPQSNPSSVVPINGRYEPIDEQWQDDQPHFGRGEHPPVHYMETDALDPNGFPIGEACDFSRTVTFCLLGGPCPSPTNTLGGVITESVEGAWDCSGGRQVHVLDRTDYTCSQTNGTNLATRRVVTTTREWAWVVLSREGCEGDPCSSIPATPGSGIPVGGPVADGGCAGCREGPGL